MAQGLAPKDISTTKDAHDRFTFTLNYGTDYLFTSDFNLYIYLDDVLWMTVPIQYDSGTKAHVFTTDDITNIAVWIFVIFISSMIGFVMKDTEGQGTAAFMAVSVFASMVKIDFLWLTFFCILYFILRIVDRVIRE